MSNVDRKVVPSIACPLYNNGCEHKECINTWSCAKARQRYYAINPNQISYRDNEKDNMLISL